VILRPRVRFSGARIPDAAVLDELHAKAHDACFIANSVRSAVSVEPVEVGT
jgi:organic hydroperoxide reductase OsmC/OhrA